MFVHPIRVLHVFDGNEADTHGMIEYRPEMIMEQDHINTRLVNDIIHLYICNWNIYI